MGLRHLATGESSALPEVNRRVGVRLPAELLTFNLKAAYFITVEPFLEKFKNLIWKKISKYKKTVRMLIAFPFAKPNDLPLVMKKVQRIVDLDYKYQNGLNKLLKYYKLTKLGERSLFKPKLWSHFENFDCRANNNIESWHNKLNSRGRR